MTWRRCRPAARVCPAAGGAGRAGPQTRAALASSTTDAGSAGRAPGRTRCRRAPGKAGARPERARLGVREAHEALAAAAGASLTGGRASA